MKYIKYEFDVVPEILSSVKNVVVLGYLLKQDGTYDEDGVVITEPIYSDKIAVDVLYHNEILIDLEPYRVYPLEPKHFIAGMEELYFNTIK